MTTAQPAKEIRLFRLREQLLSRFGAAQDESRRIQLDLQVRGAVIHAVARTAFIVGYAGAIVWVVHRAVQGDASVGDVLLTAVLAGQLLNQVGGAGELTQWANRTLSAAARFVYLDNVARRADSRAGAAVVPIRLSDGIRLSGVSFRYPGASSDTLVGTDIRLPAGSTVALVGDNGAGKSTLVKLLAGLCRPTAGTITVDDVDLADLDPVLWRARISAAFQDHARFELTLREAVGIGDLTELAAPSGADAVVRLAFERGGAADVLDGLVGGLDTQLGPRWPDGIDISGGQWQKIAIARAMMRTRPLLLLLDEPTAALDAETEHRLFAQWTAAAAALRRSTGAITLLISHRFSTVRMADLILVLDGGRIVESGRHDELMARGGLYAEFFGIQARAYRP
jgi:ATP-binding cassette subfamily B protein